MQVLLLLVEAALLATILAVLYWRGHGLGILLLLLGMLQPVQSF